MLVTNTAYARVGGRESLPVFLSLMGISSHVLLVGCVILKTCTCCLKDCWARHLIGGGTLPPPPLTEAEDLILNERDAAQALELQQASNLTAQRIDQDVVEVDAGHSTLVFLTCKRSKGRGSLHLLHQLHEPRLLAEKHQPYPGHPNHGPKWKARRHVLCERSRAVSWRLCPVAQLPTADGWPAVPLHSSSSRPFAPEHGKSWRSQLTSPRRFLSCRVPLA